MFLVQDKFSGAAVAVPVACQLSWNILSLTAIIKKCLTCVVHKGRNRIFAPSAIEFWNVEEGVP